jgi:hypothetical protein
VATKNYAIACALRGRETTIFYLALQVLRISINVRKGFALPNSLTCFGIKFQRSAPSYMKIFYIICMRLWQCCNGSSPESMTWLVTTLDCGKQRLFEISQRWKFVFPYVPYFNCYFYSVKCSTVIMSSVLRMAGSTNPILFFRLTF